MLELDVAPCQLLLSLTPHGKWQWEVKGLVLTWTCPHPLETSPRGSIRLRMSGSLPVYGQALLPGACCLRMGFWESQFLTKKTPSRLNFALIKNQILAGRFFFAPSEMDLTEPQRCPFAVTLLAATVPAHHGCSTAPLPCTPLTSPTFSPF